MRTGCGKPVPASLLPISFLFFLLFSSAPAGAETPPPPPIEDIGWGLWVSDSGGTFRPLHPQVTLCVQSGYPVEIRLDVVGEHPGYRFEPAAARPHCQSVMGGIAMYPYVWVGEVRILVTRFPPQTIERPGVVPLTGAGQALLIPAGSAASEIRTEPRAGTNVSAFAWPSLVPLDTANAGPSETTAVLVLVTEGDAPAGVLRWSDPEWIDRSPRLGAVLAVVAVALLLTLYRGTPGRSIIRPPRRGGDQARRPA